MRSLVIPHDEADFDALRRRTHALQAEREELRAELVRRTTALDEATAELTRLRERYEGPAAKLMNHVEQQLARAAAGELPTAPFMPPRRE